MINVKQITFSYPKGKQDTLHNFSLQMETGNVYGLLGKNGAGKSTLLYLLCGLLTPQQGEVSIDNIPVRQRCPELMRQIFLVPEEFNLPDTSLKNYIKTNSCFYPTFDEKAMARNLELFEMEADIRLETLSMGQKKKVFIAFALACNTPYLIMDEPTNGLDIMGKSQFRKLISANMTDEKTVIISTHQVRDIDQLLDHIIIIDNSEVLMKASTLEISKRLKCVVSFEQKMTEQALFALPSLQGNQLILPNTDNEDTELNLELLFGAALSHPEEFKQMFTTQS